MQSNKILITNIAIESAEQRHYVVWLSKTDGFDDADVDVDALFACVDLDLTVNGRQITGTTQWRWNERVSVRYIDEDSSLELHCSIQNLGPGAKTAGAGGALVLKFTYYPVG